MQNNKQKFIEIFENTMEIVKNNKELLKNTNNSLKDTKIYNEKIEINKEKNKNLPKIRVLNTRTLKAIENFTTQDDKIAILNFASATNPGGGVTKGSVAQEECICRCTNLYSILSKKEIFNSFYLINRNRHNTLYSDSTVYTPNVYIIKSDIEFPEILPKNQWKTVNIITCAAPNLKELKINDKQLLEIHKSRAKQIISTAIVNNNTKIVLGAFGCGAFRNNPEIVARAYKEVLIDEEFAKYFDEIIFAVLATPNKNIDNFSVFDRWFKKYN